MRIATIVAVALFTSGGLSAAERAHASITHYELNIPRQPLDTALKDLAQQTGLQVGRFSDAVKGDTVVGPVTGNYSADQALKTLLAPTGLTYRTLNDRAIIVLRPEDVAQLPAAKTLSDDPPLQVTGEGAGVSDSGKGAQGDEDSAGEAPKKSFWSRLRLAQSSNQTDSSVGNSPSQGSSEPGKLEEITVTAQKRPERASEVPIPVTAVDAQSLVNSNQLSLQDYYTRIPGLSLSVDNLRGQANLYIRGLSLNGASPTVGLVVDDLPYGASTSLGGGLWVPDIDPSDIARIEVLRGPQGTLYGASSIGGLIKYVTVDPSTDRLSGSVQAGGSGVANGAQVGYSARGSVNVPINDTLAVRASAFTRLDPGYIDSVVTHEDGINKLRTSGARVAALWHLTDDVSLKLAALFQDSKRYGSSDADVGPGLGDLQNNELPRTGTYDRKVAVYSANLTAKLPFADLTAVSGYMRNQLTDVFDYTEFYGGLSQQHFQVSGAQLLEHSNTDKFTQEIRLSSLAGHKVDWLLGAFYTHEKSPHDQGVLAADLTTGAVVGPLLYLNLPTKYEEYAAFADVTIHFTDRFDVQIGGRESEDRQSYSEIDTGVVLGDFGAPSPRLYPRQDSKDNSFTYLVTPRFKISPDLMAYVRLASGYQPGGPNAGAPAGVPQSFGPSKAQNYEIGMKGDWLGHTLSIDASLYYISLRDIQLSLADPTLGGYLANGGRAKSQGVEIAIESRPLKGLKVAAWATLGQSVLTEAFPAQTTTAYGAKGDLLPNSPRFTGNLSVEKNFPLGNEMSGFAGATVSYFGRHEGQFPSVFIGPERQYYSPYAKTDLHAGVLRDQWTLNLFMNNLMNKRGVLVGGLDAYPNHVYVPNIDAYNYIAPRTIGLSVTRTF